jgi:hypothetical protein
MHPRTHARMHASPRRPCAGPHPSRASRAPRLQTKQQQPTTITGASKHLNTWRRRSATQVTVPAPPTSTTLLIAAPSIVAHCDTRADLVAPLEVRPFGSARGTVAGVSTLE